ncbi:MAG: O-antigen ligase family protein [Candidatus Theseobacter exili]|nr:O-antigen ligase family protein [Candidatus Theseobacter exili]
MIEKLANNGHGNNKFGKDVIVGLLLSSLMGFVPLAVSSVTRNPFFFKTAYFHAVIALVLLIVCAKWVIFPERKILLQKSIFFALLFSFVFIMSYLLNIRDDASFKYILGTLFYIILFISVSSFVLEKGFIEKALLFWSGALIIAFFIATDQYLRSNAAMSTFGNKNCYGAFLVLSLPIFLASVCCSMEKWKTIIAGISAACCLCGLILSNSWGAWIGLFSGISVLLILSSKFCRSFRLRFSLSIIVIVLFAIMLVPAIRNSLQKQIAQDIRPLIWESAVRMCMDNPMIGVGPGRFFEMFPSYRSPEYFRHIKSVSGTRHAHSEFIELASETGVMGLLAFILLVIYVIYNGIKTLFNEDISKDKKLLLAGMISGITGLLVHNTIDVNLRFTSSAVPFWFCLGMIAGLTANTSKPLVFDVNRKLAYIAAISVTILAAWLLVKGVVFPIEGQVYFKQAIRLRNQGNWKEAAVSYMLALKADQSLFDARYKLAYCLAYAGEPLAALEVYKKCNEIAPHFGNVHKNMAIIYGSVGNEKAAIDEFIIQKKLNPYDIQVRENLVRIYMKMDKKTDAIVELCDIIKMFPENSKARLLLDKLTKL